MQLDLAIERCYRLETNLRGDTERLEIIFLKKYEKDDYKKSTVFEEPKRTRKEESTNLNAAKI